MLESSFYYYYLLGIHTKESSTQETSPKIEKTTCGSSKEEIKRESIWRPKDRVNFHDRKSLKTALPYR